MITNNELCNAARSFNDMAEALENSRITADREEWIKQGRINLDNLLRGNFSFDEIGCRALTFCAEYLEAKVGTLYLRNIGENFIHTAGFAFQPGPHFKTTLQTDEGWIGQAAREQKILTLTDLPEDYLDVASGLGRGPVTSIVLVPLVASDRTEGVMELGFLNPPRETGSSFLEIASEAIAVLLTAARSRQALKEALDKTRKQSRTLQQQQEKLQSTNKELEEQTQLLTASEKQLKEQQEELQTANEELEKKTEFLERGRKNMEEKNRILEQLRQELEKKAYDLSTTSRYRSEFLANMSHELRTPLNSMLLLARMLADNSDGNLLDDLVESVRIIFNSGNDLLNLINEILDLSKIEAGKMTLHMDGMHLTDMTQGLKRTFKPLAQDKGLTLEVIIDDNVPETLVSDRQRLEQILKNFLSNDVKFTSEGGITLHLFRPGPDTPLQLKGLTPENTLAVSVRDTGMGIPEAEQKRVFEAFKQVESGSNRKFGGTGLGLSISRELAHLLGGEVQLTSQEGQGTTFSLMLPLTRSDPSAIPAQEKSPLPSVAVTPAPPPSPGTKKVSQHKRSAGPTADPALIENLYVTKAWMMTGTASKRTTGPSCLSRTLPPLPAP